MSAADIQGEAIAISAPALKPDGLDQINARSPLDAARTYLLKGWHSTPLLPREKRAFLKQWSETLLDEAALASQFPAGTDLNIGLLLGKHSGGLSDVDLDCPEALVIADAILPATNLISGRASSPRSHRFYLVTPNDAATVQFQDPTDGKMLVELRGTGGQTMVPPSIHPSGERVEWEAYGEPSAIEYEELKRQVAKLAAAALLARHWPNKGGRHAASVPLAGALLLSGWSKDEADHFVLTVVRAAGDDEAKKRLADVRSTAKRLANDKAVTGGPTCSKLFSKLIWTAVHEWLELGKTAAAANARQNDDDNNAVKLPFRLTGGAVEYAEKHAGETDWQYVCSRLEVAAVTRNEIGEEWGRLLKFPDPDGRMHSWAMPMDSLAGDGTAYREHLLSTGLHIGPGSKARNRLHEYIQTTTPTSVVSLK